MGQPFLATAFTQETDHAGSSPDFGHARRGCNGFGRRVSGRQPPDCTSRGPGGAKVGAGYFAVRNIGPTPDRLVAIESPAAGRVEIHVLGAENGIASMPELTDGLPVPAGVEATLSPGSNHVIFVDLKTPFRTGETVPETLIFERVA